MLGLHQFVDQTGRGGKTYPSLLPACRHAKSGEQVGLAGAAFADKEDGFGPIDIAAFGQVAHLRRRHIRRLRVIELLQRFHAWKMCVPDAALNRVGVDLDRYSRLRPGRASSPPSHSATACNRTPPAFSCVEDVRPGCGVQSCCVPALRSRPTVVLRDIRYGSASRESPAPPAFRTARRPSAFVEFCTVL